jgi:hypothetical protein
MKDIIKKLLRENIFTEEFVGGELYGYHVTSVKNLESIKQNGLTIGHRQMQGKGLYGFYSYEHALRYAKKGEIKDPIIVKFYVTVPSRFLYLNMEIAKHVLGNDYRLMNQIEKYFYGGFDEFYSEVLKANPNMSKEELVKTINKIENDNTEMKQRTFVFHLIPSVVNDKLNIVWDGNYGLEFRINNPRLIKVVGYDVIGNEIEKHEFNFIDGIPQDSKYDMLRDFLNQNPRLDSFSKAYKVVGDLYMDARTVQSFDYYNKLYDLLGELI